MSELVINRAGDGEAADEPQFYTVAEVARLYRVSVMSIYRALNAGSLPETRRFGRRLIRREVIDADLDKNSATPVSDILPSGPGSRADGEGVA